MPPSAPLAPGTGTPTGPLLARGAGRLLADMGYAVLMEFSLAGGRRADVAGLHRSGEIVIVEVKSSANDFRADHKWHEYRAHCDRFYFAVPESFPREMLPSDAGLIVADPFGGTVVRDAEAAPLHASRRRAMTLRFARKAAFRLTAHTDPGPAGAPQA